MSGDEHYRKQVYKFRETLIAAQADQSAQFDKALLTLSGGALGLTLTLTSTLELKADVCLASSWILYGLSLVATLFSFKFSEQQFRVDILSVDKYLRHESEDILGKNPWARSVLYLNTASAAFFLLATIIFMVLVFDSVGKVASPGENTSAVSGAAPFPPVVKTLEPK